MANKSIRSTADHAVTSLGLDPDIRREKWVYYHCLKLQTLGNRKNRKAADL